MTDMPDTTVTATPHHARLRGTSPTTPPATTRPATPIADTKAPGGPIDERWETRKFEARLVNPANRRKLSIIIVGTGLAGASAAATLGEAGYNVKSFCYQDSPRRAHSIAAQGGINAAKNYKERRRLRPPALLRHRQGRRLPLARVQRLPAGRGQRQHHRPVRRPGRPVRPRVRRPARQPLLRRRAGLAHLLRPRPDRPAAADRRLPGARAPGRRRHGRRCYTRHEMLELIVVDGKARGIIARDMVTGEIETHLADVVVLASGGYGNVFFLSTNAMGCNVTATWRAHRKGAYMANPCYTQIHPTCIPVTGEHQSKLTLMSESLRNDGRIWVPKNAGRLRQGPARHPRGGPRLLPGADLPGVRQPGPPRHRLPRRPRTCATRAAASAPRSTASAAASTSTSPTRSSGSAATAIEEKYGNLFDMYARITGENPYEVPMRIYPAVHYVMGGLWVDYDLQSHDPRPVRDRRGQLLRPRRQPARRLGADAGPGRRLLRAAEHDPRLPRRRPVRARSPRTTRRWSRPQQAVAGRGSSTS